MTRAWIILIGLLCAVPLSAQPELLQPDPLAAVQGLITDLKTKTKAHERASAAYRLGQTKNPAAVPALVSALANDQDSYVASSCASALAVIGDARAVPALLEAAEKRAKDMSVLNACLDALLPFASPAATAPMLAVAANPDRDTSARVRALMILETLNDRTIEPRIVAIIETERNNAWMVASRAALLAGRLEMKTAIPHIIGLLTSDSAPTRVAAMQALTCMPDPAALLPLNDAARDPESGIRALALEALAAQKQPKAFPTFFVALRDKDASVRASAVTGMASCGSEMSAASLLRVLRDSDPGVRHRAAEALAAFPATEEEIAPLLADADPHLRAAAAQALGAIGHPQAAEALAKRLADPDGEVHTAAVTALSRLGLTAVDVLLPLLQAESPAVRIRAADTLGRLQAVKAIPALTALQDDPDPGVRLWALAALNAMPKGSGAVFTKALKDLDPAVRCEAARLIAARKVAALAPALVPLLAEGTPRERLAAHAALCVLAEADLGVKPEAWMAWAERHAARR